MIETECVKDRAIRMAKKELAPELLQEHVPWSVLESVRNGLMTLPLAPEYEIHCESCKTCAENYDFVKNNLNDFSGFSRSILPDKGWRKVSLSKGEGTYKANLLAAFEVAQRIYAVAGELNCSVYDDELCNALESFLKKGGKFNIIAGPAVEKAKKTGKSPFLELVKRNVAGINYYVSERRQNLHFALGDKTFLINLEAYHDSRQDERMEADKSYVDWSVIAYLKLRYETAFSSPDVRPYSNDSDVILDFGDDIQRISQAIKEQGLEKFGKYGYSAIREKK